MAEPDLDRWLRSTGRRVLSNLGLRPGHRVADLGCRNGGYLLPAAQIVGEEGRVYGVDMNADALVHAHRLCTARRLNNVTLIEADLRSQSPIRPGVIDIALLFDVTHNVFFPDPEQRVGLFQRVHRLLKPNGRVALYPTHMTEHGPGLQQVCREISRSGFREVDHARRHMLHDDRLVRGWVFVYQRR